MKELILSVLTFSFIILGCGDKTQPVQSKDKESATEAQPTAVTDQQVTTSFDTVFTFESCKTGSLPQNWIEFHNGRGDTTNWQVIDDNGNKVMAQLFDRRINNHFNVAVFNGVELKNCQLEVRFKAISGHYDQGGGLVWRYQDQNNYYILRANPLENNIVLYKMENGRRSDLPIVGKGRSYGVKIKVPSGQWQQLKVVVKDSLFTVYFNGKQIFQVIDNAFSNAGKIGLWTKADAVTYFDDYKVSELR